MSSNLVILFLSLSLMSSCGRPKESVNKRTNTAEMDQMKRDVLALQGTIAQLEAFTASDFSDCNDSLPPFEAKICKIAQTSTAEQRLEYVSQLREITKIFQTTLYGPDCVGAVSPSCPGADSLVASLESLQEEEIPSLQAEISRMQRDILEIQDSIQEFNGTIQSIEAVLVGLEQESESLSSRISSLERLIDTSTIFRSIQICEDIPEIGPVTESLLISGDFSSITAYIQNGGSSGLAQIKSVGDNQGNLYLETTVGSKSCKFKIYEEEDELRVCWNNSDRKSRSEEIDQVCGQIPGKECTCVK